MVDDLKQKTLQLMFDVAVRHCHEQGGRSTKKRGGAAYYGHDGKRCIVGMFIPGRLYDERMEGVGLAHLENHYPKLAEELDWLFYMADFYRVLMSVHDASMLQNAFPIATRFKKAAVKLGVDSKLVDAVDWPEFWE